MIMQAQLEITMRQTGESVRRELDDLPKKLLYWLGRSVISAYTHTLLNMNVEWQAPLPYVSGLSEEANVEPDIENSEPDVESDRIPLPAPAPGIAAAPVQRVDPLSVAKPPRPLRPHRPTTSPLLVRQFSSSGRVNTKNAP